MQPHPWIVEFAIRDEQEREQRAMRRADRDGALSPPVTSPRAHQRLQAIGRLLVLLGEWLSRRRTETSRIGAAEW